MTWQKRIFIMCLFSVVGLGLWTGNHPKFLTSAYNQIRPYLVRSGGQSCFEQMALKNIQFKSLGNVGPGNCMIKDAVRIENFQNTKLSGPITLNCTTSLSLANWLKEIEAREVEHLGSYNCRKIHGTNIMSEHSFGSAVDIASINGISLRTEWKKNDANGEYLRQAGKVACKHFANALTPDYNAAHHDHFHLDNGYQRICPLSINQRIKRAALKLMAVD